MQVLVRRTGGIAGVNEQLGPVDTAQAGEEGQRIEQKVEEIGFFEMPERLPGGEDIRDAFEYSVTVDDGYRSHTVSFTETPDDTKRGLQHLIALVEDVAGEWKDVRLDPGIGDG
jgi:hypothetical protein